MSKINSKLKLEASESQIITQSRLNYTSHGKYAFREREFIIEILQNFNIDVGSQIWELHGSMPFVDFHWHSQSQRHFYTVSMHIIETCLYRCNMMALIIALCNLRDEEPDSGEIWGISELMLLLQLLLTCSPMRSHFCDDETRWPHQMRPIHLRAQWASQSAWADNGASRKNCYITKQTFAMSQK